MTDPPNPELLTMLEAFADETRPDRDEVVLEMSSVLPKRYPNDPEVLTWCAYCHFLFYNNTEEAADIMRRVVRDPNAPAYAFIVLAGLRPYKGSGREAIAALQAVDRIQPGNLRALDNLLELYTSRGMADEAFELAQAILRQETMPLEDRYGDEFNEYVNDVFIGRYRRDRLRARASAIIEARGRA